jgi:hypothetical protein
MILEPCGGTGVHCGADFHLKVFRHEISHRPYGAADMVMAGIVRLCVALTPFVTVPLG